LDVWARALGGRLRHRGTLTFVLPTGSLPEAMAAMTAAGCAPAAVFPLWPRAGQAAKLMLLRGVRGGRMAPRLLAGMALHAADGFTAEAEAVLRRGAAIDLA
jgi:tRNA1(Val) A37 N6-methylase TrmN6